MFKTVKSRLIILGVAFTILLACIVYNVVVTSGPQEDLSKITAQFEFYTNKKAMLQAALDKGKQESITEASGLNAQRKAKDDEEASRFFKLADEWKSKQTYDAARKLIMDRYGIKPDSDFMTHFMPEVPSIPTDGGKSINDIDANKASLHFSGLTSYVTKIVGDKYEYIAFVKVSSSRNNATANATQMFTYTMDMDQHITNVKPYGLTSIQG